MSWAVLYIVMFVVRVSEDISTCLCFGGLSPLCSPLRARQDL